MSRREEAPVEANGELAEVEPSEEYRRSRQPGSG